MSTTGEDPHDKGAEGVRKARAWLTKTTRTHQLWTTRDKPFLDLLVFDWPHPTDPKGTTFSFDLGGTLRGDTVDGNSFVAEVKNYKNEGSLPTHYRDFLAKCYVSLAARPDLCDHFLWISWAPFQAQKWDEHTSAENIKKALLHPSNRKRVFGTDDPVAAELAIDVTTLFEVSSRIWLLTMTDRLNDLVLVREHFELIQTRVASEAYSL